MRSYKLWSGSCLMLVFLILSFLSFFLEDSTQVMDLSKRYDPPSWFHPFGFDENGSDVFRLILHGSRVSFFVAFSVTGVSLLVGLVLGTLSGYYTKVFDPILMRLVDMIYAFPNFLLAMALMAILGSSVLHLIFVLSISTWATYARLTRAEIIHLKKKDFVQSARSLGANRFRQTFFHIWPNLIPVLSVQTVLTLSAVILAESGLSFLGIGVPSTVPTWGSLLQSGRQSLVEAPHLSIFPGLCLFVLVLSCYLTGEGLREWFSPYSGVKKKILC